MWYVSVVVARGVHCPVLQVVLVDFFRDILYRLFWTQPNLCTPEQENFRDVLRLRSRVTQTFRQVWEKLSENVEWPNSLQSFVTDSPEGHFALRRAGLCPLPTTYLRIE